jgi:hypothetical protein
MDNWWWVDNAQVPIRSYQIWGLCLCAVGLTLHVHAPATSCCTARGVPEVDRSDGFRNKDKCKVPSSRHAHKLASGKGSVGLRWLTTGRRNVEAAKQRTPVILALGAWTTVRTASAARSLQILDGLVGPERCYRSTRETKSLPQASAL